MDKKKNSNKIIWTILFIIIVGIIIFILVLLFFNKRFLNEYIDNQKNMVINQQNKNINSATYSIDDICKYRSSICDSNIDINNNGTIYSVKLDVDKTTSKSNITINGKIDVGSLDEPVSMFGLYQYKYLVVVQKDTKVPEGLADNIVSFYDKKLNLVKKVKMVQDDYKISDSNFIYYSCQNGNTYIKKHMYIYSSGKLYDEEESRETKTCTNGEDY